MKRDDIYKYNGLKSPIWSGLHSPLFSSFSGSSLAGSGIHYWYVDSVNGSDSNDGTAAAPFQTLSKAQTTVTDGQGIALVRGSHWREQLDVPANNISIIVAGSGDMPIIDGADIVTTGWAQPDSVTYPNVWSRSWTRTGPDTTASAYLGYWEGGVRATHRASLAALQAAGAAGNWNTTSFTSASAVTVSIYSAADPNSDGILREIGKRNFAINSKDQSQTGAATSRTGLSLTGPIEAKRCIGHSNALAINAGTVKQALLRDGNIHACVISSQLVEDIIATERSPDIANGMLNAFRANGVGHNPVWRRCGALLPGGGSRATANQSSFYSHASVAGQVESFTLEGCFAREADNATLDGQTFNVNGFYQEDSYQSALVITATNNNFNHVLTRDTAQTTLAAGNPSIRRLLTTGTFTAEHCAFHNRKGAGITNVAGGTLPSLSNVGVWANANDGISGGSVSLYNSVVFASGRSLVTGTSYVGDYNVFHFIGQAGAQFNYNGTNYLTVGTALASFQTASGQDANSVFLKAADQTSGNANAFYLGVSTGANAGPADGDWRINPSAKVYNSAGAALTGTFADGVTPITQAGPQEHWDFNQRAVVSGPPSRYPVLPVTVAEMRTYVEDPAAWDFYP